MQHAKNQFEKQLLEEYLKRYGKNVKFSYTKVLNLNVGKKLVDIPKNVVQTALDFAGITIDDVDAVG